MNFFKTFLINGTALSYVSAYAQDTSKDTIVVTASGIEQPSFETGQAITVVSRDRIDSLQSINIADVLRTLPSVSVAQKGPVGSQTDDYNIYGGKTTFGGNIAYTPNKGRTVFRATYGEGFRAPTLSEGQPPFGNPNLKPETARNFDLGVEHTFPDGSAQVYATYFNRHSNDLINYSAAFQLENIDRVKTQGLETGIMLRPANAWDIRLGYSLVNAINCSATNCCRIRHICTQRICRYQSTFLI